MGGADSEGVEETDADGGEDSADDHKWHGATCDGNADARDNSGEGDGEDEGEIAHAGLDGGDVVDDLEVDGQEVEDDEVRARDGEGVGHALPDVAVLQ